MGWRSPTLEDEPERGADAAVSPAVSCVSGIIELSAWRIEEMNTREITIRVDTHAARAYGAASPGERRKIDLLLALRLGEVMGLVPSLPEVMRHTSRKAQERGLTEETLTELLRED